MKKSLCSILAIFLILIIPASVSASNQEYVISQKDFQEDLPSIEVLYEKALKGELINDDFVQVDLTVSKDNTEKVVNIKRLLNEKTLNNGETIKTYEIAALASITRPVEEIVTDGSYTWTLRGGFLCDVRTYFNGTTNGYNPYNMYMKADILDSRFRNYSLYQELTASGQAFTSSGTPTMISPTTVTNGTFMYPLSGAQFSKTTGWTFYLIPNDPSGTGTDIHYKYQRTDTGSVYSYLLKVRLTP